MVWSCSGAGSNFGSRRHAVVGRPSLSSRRKQNQNNKTQVVYVCACFVPGPCRSWVQGSLAWLCVPLPSRGPVFAKTVSLLCLGTWSLLGRPCVCVKVLSILALCVGIVSACLYVRSAGAVIQLLDHTVIKNLLTWPSAAKLPTLRPEVH